jgi:hypothetical protein
MFQNKPIILNMREKMKSKNIKKILLAVLIILFAQIACISSKREGRDLPYYGFFIESGKELVELYKISGITSTGPRISGDPPISNDNPPTIYAWESDVINLKYLVLLSVGHLEEIEFHVKSDNDDVLQLIPKTSLGAGNYCFVQQDPMMMSVEFPGWCFTIAGDNSSINVTQTEVVVKPEDLEIQTEIPDTVTQTEEYSSDEQTTEQDSISEEIPISEMRCPDGIIQRIGSGDYSDFFPGATIANCRLSGLDFRRVDFTDVTFFGINFNSSDFSKAIFHNTIIMESKFPYAKLDETDFSDAVLQWTELIDLEYEGNFEDYFGDAKLENCVLDLDKLLDEKPQSIDYSSNFFFWEKLLHFSDIYWKTNEQIIFYYPDYYELDFSNPDLVTLLRDGSGWVVQRSVVSLNIDRITLAYKENGGTTIGVWSPAGEQISKVFFPEKIDFYSALVWSPSGRFLGWAESKKEVVLLDFDSEEKDIFTFDVEAGQVLAFSPDERLILTTSDNMAVITNIQSGEEEFFFRVENTIDLGGWSPDGKYFYTVEGGNLIIRDAESLELIFSDLPYSRPRFSWSPDGKYLLIFSIGEAISLLSTENGSFETVYSFNPPYDLDSFTTDLSWRPDSQSFLIADGYYLLHFDLDQIEESTELYLINE